MSAKDISVDSPSAEPAHATSPIGRNALFTVILGLLTVASILLLIYQTNRALQLGIEAAEVWSDYQVKIVKAAIEEDPNLKQQYTEEQDVLRQHAQDLKQNGITAKQAAKFSTYAAVLLLLGTATAVLALLSKSHYVGYVGLTLGIIGVGLGIRPLL